jgi:hypothetical protein
VFSPFDAQAGPYHQHSLVLVLVLSSPVLSKLSHVNGYCTDPSFHMLATKKNQQRDNGKKNRGPSEELYPQPESFARSTTSL